MRKALKTALAFMIAGIVAGGVGTIPAKAGTKDYARGMATKYVPIPTYGLIKAEWNKSGNTCWWTVEVDVKQLGGRATTLGKWDLQSPSLCDWAIQKEVQEQNSSYNSLNLNSYLTNEAKNLNDVVTRIFNDLKGKIGADTLVYSFHFVYDGQDWYYPGVVVSGMNVSYGWQKKPDKNYIIFYYNSTNGKISDQAPKPTDVPDSLPVLDTTDDSTLAKKMNELNQKVKGGYEEIVYLNGEKSEDHIVNTNYKYDTFAEYYSEKDCNGNTVSYNAQDYGKGITAFEKEVAIPELQRKGFKTGTVVFFYSPTIYSLDDKVTERKLYVTCPSGYTYICGDYCMDLSTNATATPTYHFKVTHEITAHLSRDAVVDLVTADGKITNVETTTFELPDYVYHVTLEKTVPANSLDSAKQYVKNRSLSIDDCNYGNFEAYDGGTQLTVDATCTPPPPPPKNDNGNGNTGQGNAGKTIQSGLIPTTSSNSSNSNPSTGSSGRNNTASNSNEEECPDNLPEITTTLGEKYCLTELDIVNKKTIWDIIGAAQGDVRPIYTFNINPEEIKYPVDPIDLYYGNLSQKLINDGWRKLSPTSAQYIYNNYVTKIILNPSSNVWNSCSSNQGVAIDLKTGEKECFDSLNEPDNIEPDNIVIFLWSPYYLINLGEIAGFKVIPAQ